MVYLSRNTGTISNKESRSHPKVLSNVLDIILICCYCFFILIYKIQRAKEEGAGVVDIDRSYLARNHTSTSSSGLTCAPFPLSDEPPLGWNDVTEENREEMAEQVHAVFPTTLYSYMYIPSRWCRKCEWVKGPSGP